MAIDVFSWIGTVQLQQIQSVQPSASVGIQKTTSAIRPFFGEVFLLVETMPLQSIPITDVTITLQTIPRTISVFTTLVLAI